MSKNSLLFFVFAYELLSRKSWCNESEVTHRVKNKVNAFTNILMKYKKHTRMSI